MARRQNRRARHAVAARGLFVAKSRCTGRLPWRSESGLGFHPKNPKSAKSAPTARAVQTLAGLATAIFVFSIAESGLGDIPKTFRETFWTFPGSQNLVDFQSRSELSVHP
jgi:hypothetical protein